MWHHRFYSPRINRPRFNCPVSYQAAVIFTLIALTAACTAPLAPVSTAPPATQRILIPTPEAVSAAQFADTAAPASGAVAAVVGADRAESAAAGDGVESASPLTPAQTELLATLPSRGAAPELHNEVWFNTEPLTLASLRGKVVMVEFWTYG